MENPNEVQDNQEESTDSEEHLELDVTPTDEASSSSNDRVKPPWWTEECEMIRKKCYRARRAAQKTKTIPDCPEEEKEEKYNELKIVKKEWHRVIKKAKKDYEKKLKLSKETKNN